MRNSLLGFALGALIMSVAGLLVFSRQPQALSVSYDTKDLNLVRMDTPTPTVKELDQNELDNIKSIKDVMKLKSDFKQTEKLYRLAGRATPRELLGLIKQADSIVDPSDWSYALSILFARLTEIDPELALEAANDERFLGNENISSAIWRTWARQDFDAALLAASKLTPLSRKEYAARTMYWAFGVFGNGKTEKIKAATGVEPTRFAVSGAIEKIAKHSVSEAIESINLLQSLEDQRHVAQRIGQVSAVKSPDSALSYTKQFKSHKVGRYYRLSVLKTIGSNSPVTVLQSWSNDNYDAETATAAYSAFKQLAYDDFSQAKAYVEAMPDSSSKTRLVRSLLAIKANSNAIDALSMANQFELAGHVGVVNYLIGEMVKISPASALLVIEAVPDIPNYKRHVARAVGGLADLDPAQAIAKIQLLSDVELAKLANQSLIMSWASTDVNAAISYALTLDDIGQGAELFGAAFHGVDFEIGMRFLEKFGDVSSGGFAYSFATGLTTQYDWNELVAKLQPYRSSQHFDMITMSLMSTLSTASVSEAEFFINSFWSGDEKSSVYTSYAMLMSNENPQAALGMLDKLDVIEDKQAVLEAVISRMGYQDKVTARNVLVSLPAGPLRDAGVSAFATHLSPDKQQDMTLLESMLDSSMKDEAISRMLISNLKSKGDAVIELGQELGLSEERMTFLQLKLDCSKNSATNLLNILNRRKCTARRYSHF